VVRLFDCSASELADLIRRKEVSSRQVVEAHLERYAECNPALGAIAASLRESALAAADRCDSTAAKGPLHGVPFTVKEDIDCLGSATTHGVPSLEFALPYQDAPTVARLKAAGAIPIGRTNLSELGLRLCTVNPLHGRTRNPFAARLTVGGSSGGDAVAVATGMAPLGLGGDLGGSLRIPAQCCAVFALKPTTGRIPWASSLQPYDFGLAAQLMLSLGPLSRSVDDLRLALQVMAGRDVRDPRSVDAPLQHQRPNAWRAALIKQLPGEPLDAGTLAAIDEAGERLRRQGWDVEEDAAPELGLVNEVFADLLRSELWIVRERLRRVLSDTLLGHLERICGRERPTATALYRLHMERSRLQRVWSRFFEDYCVMIGPNWALPYWSCDADLNPQTGVKLLEDTVRFITPGNALGLPALALPLGQAEGLPRGVQIYADLWREDLCLHAAQAIESRTLPALDPPNAR
jgi:amidase